MEVKQKKNLLECCWDLSSLLLLTNDCGVVIVEYRLINLCIDWFDNLDFNANEQCWWLNVMKNNI